ncbi:HlyD family secretion protein [Vibrio crassostreae]|uniref:HlyD family secretion protein n=1 Tax=Vibrio crassostreae TaxID=246167 RepID=UPI001B30AD1D|nr:HlyD family efflux transporter periplasmic adaptor subunit [Vibrio crassostreae]
MINKKKLAYSLSALGGFLAALHFQEIEIVSPATGVIEGKNNTLQIKSPNFGNVSKVYVSTGDTVKKGDTLIAFDNQDLIYRLKSLENNKTHLSEKVLREGTEVCVYEHLLSVLDGSSPAVLEELYDACDAKQINGVTKSYVWKVNDYFNYVDAIELLKKSSETELALIEKNIQIQKSKLKKLKKHNAVQLQIEDNERELNALSQSLNEAKSSNIRYDIDINNKKTGIYNEISERLIGVTENLQETVAEHDMNEYELGLNKVKMASSTIHSPVNGVVLSLADNVGDDYYLEESEEIMLLKKDDNQMLVNARFSTKFRGNISNGMKVNIKPSLASVKRTFEGVIVHISEDSFEDQNKNDGSRYYEVKVKIDADDHGLEEGTEVSVYAIGDYVSFLRYISSVILKNKPTYETY